MFELYGRGGRLLSTSDDRATIISRFWQWPDTEYVIEEITTRNVIALKEEVAREAVESKAPQAVG